MNLYVASLRGSRIDASRIVGLFELQSCPVGQVIDEQKNKVQGFCEDAGF
jgi:hypothetical protein